MSVGQKTGWGLFRKCSGQQYHPVNMWVLGHRSSDHQTSLVTQDAGKEVNKAVPGNMKSPWSRDSNASWHLLLFKCWLVFLIIINLSNKKMKKKYSLKRDVKRNIVLRYWCSVSQLPERSWTVKRLVLPWSVGPGTCSSSPGSCLCSPAIWKAHWRWQTVDRSGCPATGRSRVWYTGQGSAWDFRCDLGPPAARHGKHNKWISKIASGVCWKRRAGALWA